MWQMNAVTVYSRNNWESRLTGLSKLKGRLYSPCPPEGKFMKPDNQVNVTASKSPVRYVLNLYIHSSKRFIFDCI